jgi:hypothetical protein
MQRFGVDPNVLQPEQITPEMQQFMQQQIGRQPSPLAIPGWDQY